MRSAAAHTPVSFSERRVVIVVAGRRTRRRYWRQIARKDLREIVARPVNDVQLFIVRQPMLDPSGDCVYFAHSVGSRGACSNWRSTATPMK